MNKSLTFYLVDDDRITLKRIKKILEDKGHRVLFNSSSVAALPEIIQHRPDCVLTDMMMPELDGLGLVKKLRQEARLEGLKIIIISSKTYEYDRQRAFDFGADGYITKPFDALTLDEQIRKILADRLEIFFWGVHGTLPVPGEQTVRYGGNTSCVSVSLSKGQFFIFDAGTGIKALSDHIVKSKRPLVGAKIFISHPHWDHINALPFFAPLYIPGNEFEIFGPAQGDISVRDVLSAQMDGVSFPIKIKEFGATVSFRDLSEERLTMGDVQISTMLLNHPGNCLGYRLAYKDRVVCYITDNELYPAATPFHNEHYLQRLTRFVMGADVLITDTTYLDEEYAAKIHWGHSSVSEVATLADRARVKTLYIFHHDPDHTDDTIDAKLRQAREMLEKRKSTTVCQAPVEKIAVAI